ncbi:MAG: PLP-dependent lyase/thiolase [Candidatus Dormibacteria bacterium]
MGEWHGPRSHQAGAEGQWVHAALFGLSLAAAARLSLGEGNTPLEPAPELARALGVRELLLKREDRNPTGSHKARSLGLLLSQMVDRGQDQAVISSSGNAGVAAAAYAAPSGIRLLTLVSPSTPRVKLERLRAQGGVVVVSRHPVALLHHARERWGLCDLRGSTNPLAPVAYRGIAAELATRGPVGAVFLFASSGATALGLAQGYEQLSPHPRPELHPVETLPGGELTRPWYPGPPEAPSGGPAAGEFGTRRSRLAPAVRRAVRQSGGRGWRVPPGALPELRQLAESRGVFTSWEGLAALAAVRQAALGGAVSHPGPWVAVLTGDQAQLDLRPAAEGTMPAAEDQRQLDRLLQVAGFAREVG